MPRLLPWFAALALAACAQQPAKDTLLDREFEAYRGDREERRYDDLKARYAKAKAEADRLDAEVTRLEKEREAKKLRVSDATAAALRLPEPLKVDAAPAVPPRAAGAAR